MELSPANKSTGGAYTTLRFKTAKEYNTYLQNLRERHCLCSEENGCLCKTPSNKQIVCELCHYACCKDAVKVNRWYSGVSYDCRTCNVSRDFGTLD